MSRWFRHYAGLARDEKLVRVAIKSSQPVERVVWVWVAILESAAEVNDNGRYDFDADEAAYFLRTEAADVRAIEAALADLGRLDDGHIAKWSERQFISDTGAERQKRYRDKRKAQDNVTDNVTVTSPSRNGDAPETDTDTDSRNLKVPCPKPVRTRKAYPEKFQEFWEGYPTDNLMSKSEAGKAWDRLTGEDQALALASLTAFKSHCAQHPDYRPVHACRYLSQRRFEGFGKFARDLESTRKIWVKVGTPQFDAWNSWWQDTKSKSMPQANGGWYVPSEFPPMREAAE